MKSRPASKKRANKCFIDIFAGCGGLSLGLVSAGWTGRFAIEKNGTAFQTLKTNLLESDAQNFRWPTWLPKKAQAISSFLSNYRRKLKDLKGEIDLIAGGPPCQGFSMAGHRNQADPRNALMHEYIRIVRTVQPRFILIENVQGFQTPFRKNGHGREKDTPYSKMIADKLASLGYTVFSEMVDLSLFWCTAD